MKKGEVYEGVIEYTDFPNKGILHIEDRTVVIKNALPGQRIRFSVSKLRQGRCEGRLLEILEPSAAENAEAACPHAGICGGCLYQSLPYSEELKIKEMQVKKLLKPFCGDDLFEGLKPSPNPDAYRNKMEFSFGDEYKDGPLALGMHKRGSFYDIVNTEYCHIVDEDFRMILKEVHQYFSRQQIPFYHKLRHEGYLRHLLVRKAVGTGEILIVLVTACRCNLNVAAQSEDDEDLLKFERVLLAEVTDAILCLPLSGKLAGVLHTVNNSLADVVKSEETKKLYGQDYFYEKLFDLRFKVTPFSFFQTNTLGAEVLYSVVRDYIGDTRDKRIYDLYSGTGTIAQILAPVAREVIGVEIVEEAVEAARVNASHNGLTNCRFIAGDVLKVLDTIEEKPDFIILDPPRDGIHPKALPKILDYRVERIVYISCKVTSLVRDLEVFAANGYEVVRACAVDMFARTGNIETVVLLSR